MKILLFGKDGQLGREFIPVIGTCSEFLSVGRAECDLADEEQIQVIIQQFKPDVIINASAYTAVDQAEKEVELARLVNTQAPTVMAQEAQRLGAAIVHYSTDYVFDGRKQSPYFETDECHPLSVYGSTKYLGELGVEKNCQRHLIFRTSWVFSAHGSNFLKTILRLAASKETLNVIDDQWGAPTSTGLIVKATMTALQRNGVVKGELEANAQNASRTANWGLFNLVASGETNWHAYAQYVIQRATDLGMGSDFVLTGSKIIPIPSKDYPQLAPRPFNSRLDLLKIKDTFDVKIADWREGVDEELEKIKHMQAIENA